MSSHLILSVMCSFTGIVLCIGGLYLLSKKKVIVDSSGAPTDLEIPIFGRIKTNSPILVAIFLGALLVFLPFYTSSASVPRFHVKGTVKMKSKKSLGDVLIGVLPNSHKTFTDNDGVFSLDVLDGETTYTGVGYYTNGKSRKYFFKDLDMTKRPAVFDVILGD